MRTAGAGGGSAINMSQEQLGPNCALVIQSSSEISATQAKVRVGQPFNRNETFVTGEKKNFMPCIIKEIN